jgi:hypothetical protein
MKRVARVAYAANRGRVSNLQEIRGALDSAIQDIGVESRRKAARYGRSRAWSPRLSGPPQETPSARSAHASGVSGIPPERGSRERVGEGKDELPAPLGCRRGILPGQGVREVDPAGVLLGRETTVEDRWSGTSGSPDLEVGPRTGTGDSPHLKARSPAGASGLRTGTGRLRTGASGLPHPKVGPPAGTGRPPGGASGSPELKVDSPAGTSGSPASKGLP